MLPHAAIQIPTTIHSMINGDKSGLKKRSSHDHSEELGELSDKELCRKAQRGCVVSRDLLWYRYGDYIQRIVHKRNKCQHLLQCEIADALQELFFAFHKAVLRYDPENHYNNGKSACFKTFLGMAIARKFSNYCALWRIYHKRVVLEFGDEASWNFPVDAMDGNGYSSTGFEKILSHELSSDGFVDALSKLKPKERQLLEVWLECERDKDVAQVLGISSAAAKLRRERLFRRLRQSVAGK